MSEPIRFSRRSLLRRGGFAVGALAVSKFAISCTDNRSPATDNRAASDQDPAADPQSVEVLFFRPTPAPEGGFPWLAESLGYWNEEGLSVSVEMTSGSPDAVRLLGTGTGHIAMPGSEAVLLGREKGLPVTDFYCHQQNAIFSVGVLADSNIESPQDMGGKRVGVLSHGSSTVPIVRSLASSAGLDPDDDITIIELGVGGAPVESLRQGQVDVVAYHDTQFLIFERAGFDFRFFETEFDDFFTAGLVAREEDIERRTDALVRFARGFSKAVAFSFENPGAAIDLMGEQVPEFLDDRELSIALLERRQDKLALPPEAEGVWGWNTHERWTEFQDFLLNQGVLEEEQDLTAIFTDELLPAINDFDEEAVLEDAHSRSES